MVVPRYSQISTDNKPAITFEHQPDPWDNAVFNRVYRIVPIKQMELLIMLWSLPSQHHHWRIKPIAFLSELFGDEGQGAHRGVPLRFLLLFLRILSLCRQTVCPLLVSL
jgi:secreted Zn-dependent insulinase-like peptidase